MGRVGAVLATAVAVSISVLAVGCGDEGSDDNVRNPNIAGARVAWGEPTGGDPIGVVMLIHGGGWERDDSGYEEQRENADNFEDRGYVTVAIGYDKGARGFRQVDAIYREARERYPDLPVCASGISAGGHLALMLAAREPELDCVIALAAPTDLTTLAAQDPAGDEGYKAAVDAFGKNQLSRFSPIRYADRIKAKVLLIVAESDPVAVPEQSRELADALPSAELLVLPPGPIPVPWAHFGGVEEGAQNIVIDRGFDFLEEATQAG
jgi:acetyl esterase/lipase